MRVAAWLLLCLLLTGCWNERPLSLRQLIVGMSVDPGGTPGSYRFTFQTPAADALKSLSGGAGSSAYPYEYFSTEAGSLNEALRRLEYQASRDMYLGQLQFILLSAKLSATAFLDFVDEELRTGELDHTQYAIVTTSSAAAVLKQPPHEETLPAVYYTTHFSCTDCQGVTLTKRFWELANDLLEPGQDLAIPLAQPKATTVAIDGVEIYRGGTAVGSFHGSTLNGYGWLTGKLVKQVLQVQTSFGTVIVRDAHGRTRITPHADSRGRPGFDVHISGSGTLARLPAGATMSSALAQQIDQRIAEKICSDILLTLLQAKAARSDPFRFGLAFRLAYPTPYAHIKDWHQAFREAPVRVEVHFRTPYIGAHT